MLSDRFRITVFFYCCWVTFGVNCKLRIVNGTHVADRSKFAYQVSFRYANGHICGGTIIDERHVLTAAHCCINPDTGRSLPVSSLSMVVGDLDIFVDSTYTSKKSVQNVFIHEEYEETDEYIINDIAVIRIVGTFGNWTNEISAINLTTAKTVPGSKCTVSGWGTERYGEEEDVSRFLQYVDVPIVDKKVCGELLVNYTVLQTGVICAGEEGKDSCQGDSGGPLVCNNKLAGVVSFGIGCAFKDLPGVYTEVFYYTDWIEEQKKRSGAYRLLATVSILLVPLLILI